MRKELTDLRGKMKEYGIDCYIIPTTDFHGSEYVNPYFRCRKFVSGFTGSAGTLVVTMDDARLWTDGRYFIQAAMQLEGSGIQLMKMREPDVPAIDEYLDELAPECLGFDGRVVSAAQAFDWADRFNLKTDVDLVDLIWEDRPAISPSEVYDLPESVTGESSESKIGRLRIAMEGEGADYHLIASLEEIAWLYNKRGSDIPDVPVFFAYALIGPDFDRLYCAEDYSRIYDDLSKLKPGCILIDDTIVNYSLIQAIPDSVDIITGQDPAIMMKALKNDTEVTSTKAAHIRDGAAMVNFLYWLKSNIGKIPMTEISVSDYLEECRRAQEGFISLSFDTIAGYADNGAIVHYFATPETNKELKPEGFLLVDSGAHYCDGTTDITRTIALGPLTDEMKLHYTLVLRSHIQLALCRFMSGSTGADIDVIARKPLHDAGLDFNHGTGHGVGHLLSVHEGPQNISPRGGDSPVFPGMITSNEPGYYLEGQYGIRLENEILCHDRVDWFGDTVTPALDGRFGFQTITFCPFERDAIVADMLLDEERQWLNGYHQAVYDKISPLVDEDVRSWLKEATAEI